MGSYAHFAGIVSISPHSNVCSAMSNSELVSWIVNTGASDHMTYETLSSPVHITLPDGTLKQVLVLLGKYP